MPRSRKGRKPVKLFEVACNIVVGEQVSRIFGLMGDGNMNLICYATDSLGVSFVSARHEAAAIGMADGYARASGSVAVCTVTQGPGLTNALTALVTARKANTPMVLFVGDVAAEQAGWPQDVDQHSLLSAAGVPVIDLANRRTAYGDVHEAFRLARESSRPVAVNCPLDAQLREWQPWDGDGDPVAPVAIDEGVDPESVRLAADTLMAAQRPVIIAGRGALRSDCAEVLRVLGERIGALLATTLPARGLFDGDPFSIGIAGSLGSDVATSLIGRADVVLAVGAALNDFTTIKRTLFLDSTTVIRCDVGADRSRPNRYPEDQLILGDARTAADLLVAVVPPDVGKTGFRTESVAQTLHDNNRPRFADQSGSDGMDPRTILTELDAILPRERQVVTDVGHFFGFAASCLTCPEPGRYFPAVDFGAVGAGLGVAIGAALARPDLTTVFVVGDGGLMMSLPDLDTATRAGVRLIVVVVNDGAYGSELQMLRRWGMSEAAATFDNPDFPALGAALGLQAVTVRSTADLPEVRRLTSEVETPILLDCRVTRRVMAGWLEGAFKR